MYGGGTTMMVLSSEIWASLDDERIARASPEEGGGTGRDANWVQKK